MRRTAATLAGLLAMAAVPVLATTLDEAIAAAMQHAPQVEAAGAESASADARVREARAAALPSAIATGSYGKGRLDPQGYFGLQSASVSPRAAQLSLEQPLYTGGRLRAGIAQARAGSRAAEASERLVRSQAIVDTAESYGDVIVTRRMVELHGQLLAQMQQVQHEAELRFDAGETSRTDVAHAAARLAEAEAALAQSRGMARVAEARFTHLTGLPAQDLAPLPPSPATPATLAETIDRARAGNPALAQAQAGLEAARAAARAARAERLPTIGAFAEGTLVRDQFFPDYRTDGTTFGVRARWQLFSSGRVSAGIAAADGAARAAEARLRGAGAMVDEQATGAFEAVQATRLVETAAARQARAAAQALESVRHEVRVGEKPQLALLDMQREATAAAIAEIQAQSARVNAAYQLLALLGD